MTFAFGRYRQAEETRAGVTGLHTPIAAPSMPLQATIGYILLTVAVFIAGSYVTPPGLDADALAAHLAAIPESALSQLSVTVLWATPLLNALCLAEGAKLLCPPLARWQVACPQNDEKFRFAVRVLTLGICLLQAYGIVGVLGGIGLIAEPRLLMTIAAITGFLGGTAVIFWLAERFRSPEGDLGIWFLLAVQVAVYLPFTIADHIEAARSGLLPLENCLVPVVFIAIAVALIRSLYAGLGTGPSRSIDILVWPPVLAQIASGYLIAMVILVSPSKAVTDIVFTRGFSLAAACALIPLIAYVYHRRLIAHSKLLATPPERKFLGKVIVAQVAITLGAAFISQWDDGRFSLSAPLLIAFTTAALAACRPGNRAASH